jgi:NADH:ubiquinone oxidoreductase subunit F (NADH-binding)
VQRVRTAIAKAERLGLLIQHSKHDITLTNQAGAGLCTVKKRPHRSIEGKRGAPRSRPPSG